MFARLLHRPLPSAARRLGHSLHAPLAVCALWLLPCGCVPVLGKSAARDADKSVPEAFGVAAPADSSAMVPVDEFFKDRRLIALIDEALANNQELRILEQEIVVANSEIMARRGEYLPKVGVGAGAGLEKVGEFSSQGASDRANDVPERLPNYQVGLFASWEIDVWGKLRNATEAATLRFMASVEGRNFAVTRLVAEVARTYFELQALDNELEVLESNLAIQTSALEAVRSQKQAGRVTELAVQRFEAEVLRNQGRRYDIRQERTAAENRINLLVGRFPQPVERNSAEFLQTEPWTIGAGLPPQLLENRPDLRKAELDLAAAKIDVDVARKQFYPSLSVDGGVGVESYRASKLTTTPESLAYGVMGGATAPLLNRLGLTAGYYASNARQMQAVLDFEWALRRAYVEVANQIALLGNLSEKYRLKTQQVATLRAAIESSTQLFASARADYMEMLLTRREALESQFELIETKQLQMNAMVDIYQQLGGGWKRAAAATTEDVPAIERAKSTDAPR